ncbi:hypothetical protein B0H11DRAFT_2281245, partial [Mycena galericulata]
LLLAPISPSSSAPRSAFRTAFIKIVPKLCPVSLRDWSRQCSQLLVHLLPGVVSELLALLCIVSSATAPLFRLPRRSAPPGLVARTAVTILTFSIQANPRRCSIPVHGVLGPTHTRSATRACRPCPSPSPSPTLPGR